MEDKKRSLITTFKVLVLLTFAILICPRPTFALLGQPSLNTPGWNGYAEGTSVTFSWDPFPNANGYLLAIYADQNLTTLFSSKWVDVYDTSNASTLVLNFPNTCNKYYWQVLAYKDGNIISDWPDAWPFNNGPNLPPSSPLVSVNRSAGYVSFQWQPPARAQSYSLGTSTIGPSNYEYVNVGSGLFYSTGTPDIGEIYYWRVGAYNCYNGGSASYSYGSFVDGPSAPPSAPSLLYPDNGTTVADFDMYFNWGSAARTTAYRLEVATDSVFSSNKIIYTDMFDSLDGSIYDQINGLLMKGQKYYWRVGAWNSYPGATKYNGVYGSLSYSATQWFIYDDALSCTSSQGYGIGLIGNSQLDIDTCRVNSTHYYLYDISRQAGQAGHSHSGSMTPPAAIKTKDYYSGLYFWESNNVWNDYPSGVDAHVSAGKVYDYLKSQFGLNSFDNGGSSMVSTIDMPCADANAYWDGSKVRYCATDSHGIKPYSGSLDIAAHEWGHAVTQMASTKRGQGYELDYQDQSGALNEAFSDWMGTAVEQYSNPTNWNWQIGRQEIEVLRDLSDPQLHASYCVIGSVGNDQPQPDHMDDYKTCINDNGGVHLNSGIPNKMFYLLSQSGTHNSVTVQGLGIEKAMEISYRANMRYWLHDATFQKALEGMVSAATDIFGNPNSNEVYQVQNAWAAVGVGTLPTISTYTNFSGSGTTTGDGSYEWGKSVTVTATAAPGYYFINWTENGTEVSTLATYNFTINGSRSLVANFAAIPSTGNISYTLSSFINTYVGEQSPPTTYTVKNNGLSSFTVSNVSITGNNPQDFTVSNTGSQDYCGGKTLTTYATCAVQVKFSPQSAGSKAATLNIQSSAAVNSLLTAPLSGTGEAPLTYTVTPSAGANGSFNPSTAQTVRANGTTSFTLNPTTGYHIESVTGCGGTLNGNTYTTGAITANCTVTATFAINTINTYTVTPSAGANGSFNPSIAQTVNSGSTASFTVTPNPGYHIDAATGCGGTLSGSTYTTGAITANCTVAASFADAPTNAYTLTVTKSGMGAINVVSAPYGISCGMNCSSSFTYGTVVTLTAVPGPGTAFIGWSGGGCGGTGSCTVTLNSATLVTALITAPSTAVTSIAAGGYSNVALKADGTRWAWGVNVDGSLGDGTQTDKLYPTQIGSDTDWSSVYLYYHVTAIKKDGTFWAWGYNYSGQIGDGTKTDKYFPVNIGNAVNWAMASSGFEHTVALRTNGTLWAWGANSFGQVGDGTTNEKLYPVQIGTETDWAAISAGSYHSVALKKDGTLWAWGLNWGQLGDGTKVNKLSPVQIGADTNWAAISAGWSNTVALKKDGTLWSWGSNYNGQVGDGTMTDRYSPVKIGTNTNWSAISTNGDHTVAIRTDGTLWAWGYNYYGELGDGTTTAKLAPVQIGSNTDWAAISASDWHTAALKTDGTLFTWGANWWGQLGDGTTTDRYSPVQISFQTRPGITVTAGSGGSVSPSGFVTVNQGQSQIFTLTPHIGYHIASVTGCGGTVSGNTYTTGAISANCTVTASFSNTYALAIAKAGIGSGTVTSSPTRISCGAICNGSFNNDSSVILSSTPDANSSFTGWSGGGCSGMGTCTVMMNAVTTVTANFGCTNNSPVRILGKADYATLQIAYDAAVEGDTIQSRGITLTGSLNANRNISVTLDGGYTCDYSSNPGSTALKGSLTTNNGTVNIKNFNLQ